MKPIQIIGLTFVSILLLSCSATERLQKKSIGLINNVSYTDSSFDNPNASNGFLVEYKNITYGITAKHISGGEDEKTKEIYLEATSIKNMFRFISELN